MICIYIYISHQAKAITYVETCLAVHLFWAKFLPHRRSLPAVDQRLKMPHMDLAHLGEFLSCPRCCKGYAWVCLSGSGREYSIFVECYLSLHIYIMYIMNHSFLIFPWLYAYIYIYKGHQLNFTKTPHDPMSTRGALQSLCLRWSTCSKKGKMMWGE